MTDDPRLSEEAAAALEVGLVEFLRSAVNQVEKRARRAEMERDRWRALLVDTVGEAVAETIYRQLDRVPATPAPLEIWDESGN